MTPSPPKPRGPFAVGLLVLRLVDHSRLIGAEPRTLVTVVRYPAVGAPSVRDLPSAQPERAGGPFPLVVFAHGYRLAPYTYAQLLHAWAHAGYVVAAPAFPLTNADAPVVDRSDLINQPQDVRFVISRLLAQRGAPLGGLTDGTRIALGGHSDGVDSALAVAYGKLRDRRVRAALGLSGAEISAFTGFSGSPRGVPLSSRPGHRRLGQLAERHLLLFRRRPAPEVPADPARSGAHGAVPGRASASRDRRTRVDGVPRQLRQG